MIYSNYHTNLGDDVMIKSPKDSQKASIRDYGNQEIRSSKKSPHRHVKNNSSIDSFAHRNKRNSKDVTLQSATELGLEMSVTKAEPKGNAPDEV